MQRKLTITIDEAIYDGLHEQIGRGHISSFIEDLVRPHLLTAADLEAGYREMAADEAREAEAREWSERLVGETLP
ncbi:MAG: addiction module antitoxin [Thermomicrobiales bacterium]